MYAFIGLSPIFWLKVPVGTDCCFGCFFKQDFPVGIKCKNRCLGIGPLICIDTEQFLWLWEPIFQMGKKAQQNPTQDFSVLNGNV